MWDVSAKSRISRGLASTSSRSTITHFDGAATISHNLSNSSAEDLMVFIYDRGAGTGLRFDLDANPAFYEIAELDEHRRRLTRLIDQVLAQS